MNVLELMENLTLIPSYVESGHPWLRWTTWTQAVKMTTKAHEGRSEGEAEGLPPTLGVNTRKVGDTYVLPAVGSDDCSGEEILACSDT